jgi:hypothetical protein
LIVVGRFGVPPVIGNLPSVPGYGSSMVTHSTAYVAPMT